MEPVQEVLQRPVDLAVQPPRLVAVRQKAKRNAKRQLIVVNGRLEVGVGVNN